VALSDAGAHLIYMCDAGFGLHFLARWVRERGDFDIVEGIRAVIADCDVAFILGPRVEERCRPLTGRAPRTSMVHESAANVEPRTLLASLTPREIEILRLIGKGFSRVQIGQQLCRSVKTIDGHQDRMLRKLGIEARADLMRFAIREGLAQA
jgi:DNA-binding NarL/FixJ family response regulator